MNRNLIEAIMGAVVLGIAAFFIVFGYSHSRWSSVDGYALTAKFDRADGLSVGTDVRISGVKVGTVVDMIIDPVTYLAKVTFSIKPEHKIPKDSSAEIVSDGLLGSKYLAIVPGGSEDMLTENSEVTHTQSSVSLEGMIGKLIFSKSDDKNKTQAAEKEMAPLTDTTSTKIGA
jgi:phospholipid/cholesterol/gamma-HCH transport system substrate-binding protein